MTVVVEEAGVSGPGQAAELGVTAGNEGWERIFKMSPPLCSLQVSHASAGLPQRDGEFPPETDGGIRGPGTAMGG